MKLRFVKKIFVQFVATINAIEDQIAKSPYLSAMRRWVTAEDWRDIRSKIEQRGWPFIMSKFNLSGLARTKSAFDDTGIEAANWWIIPTIRRRWNELATGDPDEIYEHYLCRVWLTDRKDLSLLSLGSGVCSHELTFARTDQFAAVHCLDIATQLLAEAQAIANKEDLKGFETFCKSIYDWTPPLKQYDVILFNSSLHHFKGVERLLVDFIKPLLKPDGLLVIHEYVGPDRNQLPDKQVNAIINALRSLPINLRTRFRSNRIKSKYSGPGWLRMYLADPSECVDSAAILPALRKHFTPKIERPLGGNILTWVLKDIAHHFVAPAPEADAHLTRLVREEDAYLAAGAETELFFGIYGQQQER
jgi:2-polyprenyl-3-methyl-5-hydroxy-6-metoxy-1,4-benzoquinol methylase